MAHTTKMPDTFTAFFATPIDELKEFKRPGGFSGKAISPFYLVKRLTERFGMCGKGWKVKHYDTKVVEAKSGVIAVYVLLSLLYKEPGDQEWYEVGPHYGGDVAFEFKKKERQNGENDFLVVDDEAFKKAYTDAFSKCCSWLGLGGDVHDGMTDGNKYIASKPWDVDPKESQNMVRKDLAEPSAKETQASPAVVENAAAHTGDSGSPWDNEELSEFSDLLQTKMYELFKAGGHPELYQKEADKWHDRKSKDPASTVIPALREKVEKLASAAKAAIAKTTTELSESQELGKVYDLYSVCSRFYAQYAKVDPEATDDQLKSKVKKVRDETSAKIIYPPSASNDQKKMILAKAMSEYADQMRIPA